LPCSSRTEHCGTSGTKPNLLTCVNKLVCIIIIVRNYHEMIWDTKFEAKKKPAEAGLI